MKLDMLSYLGTDYAKDKQLIKKILSNPSILVGWVDSFNAENGTVNVQPAIQDKIIDENAVLNYVNKPYLINCWVIANTLNRQPQKGDKALILVLDEKSNNFFKSQYDSSKPLSLQTFVNTSKNVKSLSNCVAIIINKNFINLEDIQNEINEILNQIENFVTIDTTQTITAKKIFSDLLTIYYSNPRLYLSNSEISYTDRPSTTYHSDLYFNDKNNSYISNINSVVGNTWNALNFDLRNKSNVSTRIEYVAGTNGVWGVNPVTTNLVNLGANTRRWKDFYLAGTIYSSSGDINDGTNTINVSTVANSLWEQTLNMKFGNSSIQNYSINNIFDFENYDYKIEAIVQTQTSAGDVWCAPQVGLSFINSSATIISLQTSWARYNLDANYTPSGGESQGSFTPVGFGLSQQLNTLHMGSTDANDGSSPTIIECELIPSITGGNYENNVTFKTRYTRDGIWCQQDYSYSGTVEDGTNSGGTASITGLMIVLSGDAYFSPNQCYIRIYRRNGGWNKFN